MHPVLTTLQLGGISRPIGAYGLMLTAALLVGGWLFLRSGERSGLESGALISSAAGAVTGGFIGAFACSTLVLWVQLGSLAAATRGSGIVFYGGLIGGAAGLALCARRFGLPVLSSLDAALPALPVAHALGRIGCLLGGCCYGAESALPWAVHYPFEHVTRHPWPLYECAALLALAALFSSPRRFAGRAGRRAASYVLAYALVRCALEPLRGDSVRGLFSFFQTQVSTSQLLSLLLACAAVLGLWRTAASRRVLAALACAGLSVLTSWALAQERKPVFETRDVVQRTSPRVHVSGGWFDMGSDEAELKRARALCAGKGCNEAELSAETPSRRVYVRAFSIDEVEVSNVEHQRCVNAGRCYPPRPAAHDASPTLPVVQLTWGEARDYCRFAGGDLPSEAQWEFAAHGSSRRSFPWGESFDPKLGAFAGVLQPVAAFPAGRSFFGLLNMAGNVWELVLDRFATPYSAELPSVDPVHEPGRAQAGKPSERVVRGGSIRSAPQALRARARAAIREDEARPDVGLRCAYPDPVRKPSSAE